MENIYVFGHKKPDTDAICAAIGMSYFVNQTRRVKAIPCTLGRINNETEFVLNKFNVSTPKYLNDVKIQIRDVNYSKNFFVDKHESILKAYEYMSSKSTSGIPIVDKENRNKLVGLMTLKTISKEMIEGDRRRLYTSYDNILDTINAEEVLRFDEEISGNILTVTYKSTTFLNDINLSNNDILVIGDRHSILEYAVNSSVKLIILIGNSTIKDEHLEIAKQNRVNIVRTKKGSFDVSNLLVLSNYVENINEIPNPVTFRDTDYLTDFKENTKKEKHTNYPVVTKNGECLGLIEYTKSDEKRKKKVILVDHNESTQSVDGLEEAEIVEIVDHHKLGTIATTAPINFRNMSVGSTCTIIYNLYKERNVELPNDIAGLLFSAILSDTLLLKSPTTTSLDIESINELSEILKIDYKDYGYKMFKAGSSLKGKTVSDIIYQDFKEFEVEGQNIGVGQIFTTNYDEVEDKLQDYIDELNRISEHEDYKIVCLFVTDIIKNGSYILFNTSSREVISDAFDINNIKEGTFLKDVVSRKKQMISAIMEVLLKG